jgi:hypothetical protein
MTFSVSCLCLLYLPRQKQTRRAAMLIDLGRYLTIILSPFHIQNDCGAASFFLET